MAFYQRKPTRLKDFDYSQPYYYFATICTADHRCFFGNPDHLNSFGEIARREMEQLPDHHKGIRVDKFVVMPNHVHTIIALEPVEGKNPRQTLSTILGCYKAAVSRQIHKISPEIELWQASFYDEIIRGERHYLAAWNYIDGNPSQWMEDKYFAR